MSATETAASKWHTGNPSQIKLIDALGKVKYPHRTELGRLVDAVNHAFIDSLREQPKAPR